MSNTQIDADEDSSKPNINENLMKKRRLGSGKFGWVPKVEEVSESLETSTLLFSADQQGVDEVGENQDDNL